MNLLLRRVHLFDPEDRGEQDVLVLGDRIAAVGKDLAVSLPSLETRDCHGQVVVPGLIDQHVHLIGGGGEDGTASRVPPLTFGDLAKAGVTTLVGTLGTDSHTRTVRDLFAKAMALGKEGATCYCLTGAYEYPSPTLTGSVADDIVYVEPVIGCKLAISDHRCSCPTTEEIIRLASQVRLGGLIGGKVGELHVHVGGDPRGIKPLFEAVELAPIPITTYRPTHMGGHVEQAQQWVEMGGYSDVTSGGSAVPALLHLQEKLNAEQWKQVTMSSDSNGSFPKWNEKHEIIGMDRGRMTTLLKTISSLVESGMSFSSAISLCTSHVADALKFKDAGHISVGKRADLLFLDGFTAESVMAKGEWLSLEGKAMKKGMYED